MVPWHHPHKGEKAQILIVSTNFFDYREVDFFQNNPYLNFYLKKKVVFTML
jgi:hypothetical protein